MALDRSCLLSPNALSRLSSSPSVQFVSFEVLSAVLGVERIVRTRNVIT